VAKVLICDDSAFMRMMLKRIFSELGHQVVAEATNGNEAVDKYRRYKPDLTTMDITMPERDGIEAVKIICREDKKPKLLWLRLSASGRFFTSHRCRSTRFYC
jgi:two-component system chemotaxis response regulator CheY